MKSPIAPDTPARKSAESSHRQATHVTLWQQKGAVILNGDKPILRYADGKCIAYSGSLRGKERLGYHSKGELGGILYCNGAKIKLFPFLPCQHSKI